MRKSEPLQALELAGTSSAWQTQLRDVITSGEQLLEMLGLSAEEVGFSERACRQFRLRVPRNFVERMRTGDPEDPLLRQVLSTVQEEQQVGGYVPDPLQETAGAIVERGIIHKYRGRVLLVAAGSCAINCRYCFRRHFPYQDNRNSQKQWREALQYIAENDDVGEVILSGGDPLILDDRALSGLVNQLLVIPHVKRLRIHSRLPIVIPDRVTDLLIDAITRDALKTVMVVHCNHAHEIDSAVASAFQRLRAADITVLNQSVLLAGVNDNTAALVSLSEALFEAGALPYYLHLFDKVAGAAHFDVPEQRARELLGEISALLPGYLVPRLAREIGGAKSKQVLAALY